MSYFEPQEKLTLEDSGRAPSIGKPLWNATIPYQKSSLDGSKSVIQITLPGEIVHQGAVSLDKEPELHHNRSHNRLHWRTKSLESASKVQERLSPVA